jgi:hypothetical protein
MHAPTAIGHETGSLRDSITLLNATKTLQMISQGEEPISKVPHPKKAKRWHSSDIYKVQGSSA